MNEDPRPNLAEESFYFVCDDAILVVSVSIAEA
jgi:hypothetical protein